MKFSILYYKKFKSRRGKLIKNFSFEIWLYVIVNLCLFDYTKSFVKNVKSGNIQY